MSDPPPAGRPTWRRFIPLAVLVAAMATAWVAGVGDYLSLEALFRRRVWLREMVAANEPLVMAAFAAVYVAAGAMSSPAGFLMTMVGGFLFGPVKGGILSAFCATSGAVILFLIARTAAGDIIARRAGPKIRSVQAGFQEGAVSYMLFLRLVPVAPFVVITIAAATFGIPLGTFAWTTLVGVTPGTLAYATAGSGLESVLAAQAGAFDACVAAGRSDCALSLSPRDLLTPRLIIALAALGVFALVPISVKAWRARRAARAGARRQDFA